MFKKIFKGILIILLSIFLLLLLVGLILFGKYNKWSQNNMSSSISCLSDMSVAENEGLRDEIEEKVKKFILSDSRTDFVVFNEQESLYLLLTNMETVEPFILQEVCLVPSLGLWEIYLKYEAGTVSLPWVIMDVVKDNRETAEIYVKEIRIGDIEIPEFLSKRIIVDINRGIADAIIMLNENRFLGRTIQNIELLEERIVIKGTL